MRVPKSLIQIKSRKIFWVVTFMRISVFENEVQFNISNNKIFTALVDENNRVKGQTFKPLAAELYWWIKEDIAWDVLFM